MNQEIKERIELINKGIVPAGYKKTSVGICPVEWIETALGKICEINPKTERLKSTFQYIDLESIVNGKVVAIKLINKQNAPSRAQRVLSKNDIIYQLVRPYQKNNFLLRNINENQIVASTGYAQLRCKNSKFIYNLINSDYFCNQVLEKCTGTNYPAITSGELYKVLVKIPTNNLEQQKIAEVLDCATRQVELQEQLVDKLKVQKKALMQRVFNGEYETISIQEALNKNYLREIKPKELQKYDGTKNYLSTSSIIQDEIVLIEDVVTYENRPSRAQMKPLENSVWFAKMTNSIKVIKANKNLEDNYILSTGFYGFLCDEINLNSNFLKQVFLSDYFNKTKDLYSEGSSQNGIKSNALEKLLIPFIELEKQLEIAEWLSFLDKNILLQQKLLEQYKLRQKALMQLLLTGIVRAD